MPKINVLSKQIAELIAAGEVVERPASVIKELVENSIDAGATVITVEIKQGGISYIRITDNGSGIEKDDVPVAFLRHATSKIKVDNDLNSISTLGFRGEALAAISSVSKVEIITKPKNQEIGTHYAISGGIETDFSEAGCPDGTTIIIKDLFYNTPARMKFLKKDVSEANACATVIDRMALSHPEISFKFIRDGKPVLNTTGDGKVKSAVYSVLGREFSNSLIEVNGEVSGIGVSGLICKPVACKATRNGQFTFLNGRLVRSGTVVAAMEQAYKNSAMVGKFPCFVIYLTVPYDTVDVNVHPAKTEVRFSDEKRIFDSVYVTVKNALQQGDTRPEVKVSKPTFNQFERMTSEQFKQTVINTPEPVKLSTNLTVSTPAKPEFIDKFSFVGENRQKTEPIKVEKIESIPKTDIEKTEEKVEVKIIGEAFGTYIVAEMGDSVFMIDKHAAHERILFNQLKSTRKIEIQSLLTPATVMLQKDEYNAIINNTELLLESGFEIDDFGSSTIAVRAVPSTLVSEDISLLLSEIAGSLMNAGNIETAREENLFHSVACKAAIKAGTKISVYEMQNLAEKVLNSKDIMYCPHGRPVAFEIKKRELEKMFGRIQ